MCEDGRDWERQRARWKTYLRSGKDSRVDALSQRQPIKDKPGTRTSQGLVGGGGDDVTLGKGRLQEVGADEATDVCNVSK
jgi:hypothetical protein